MLILLLVLAIIGWSAFFIIWFRNRSYDGTVVIIDQEEKQTFSLELDIDPYDIPEKKSLLFKVSQNQ